MTGTSEQAAYARTFSATSRHIVHPETPARTLCGGRVILTEHYRDNDGNMQTAASWMIRDLPLCKRCERSARSRGIQTESEEAEKAPPAGSTRMKTHLGGLPLASFETLSRVYGKVIYQLPEAQLNQWCADRSDIRRGPNAELTDVRMETAYPDTVIPTVPVTRRLVAGDLVTVTPRGESAFEVVRVDSDPDGDSVRVARLDGEGDLFWVSMKYVRLVDRNMVSMPHQHVTKCQHGEYACSFCDA